MNLPQTAIRAERDGILETVPGTVEGMYRASADLLRSAGAMAPDGPAPRRRVAPRRATASPAVAVVRGTR